VSIRAHVIFVLHLKNNIAITSPIVPLKAAQCGQPKDVGCLVKSMLYFRQLSILMRYLVTPTDEFLIISLDFEGMDSIERSSQEGLSLFETLQNMTLKHSSSDTLLVLFNVAISNLVGVIFTVVTGAIVALS
jgi:hypothetical protein